MPSNNPKTAPTSFTDVVSATPPVVKAIAAEVRQWVMRQLPGAIEGIHGGAKVKIALYSLENRFARPAQEAKVATWRRETLNE